MPSSMTGMGKSVQKNQGIMVEVEAKSVNNRYLVIRNRIPDSLMQYEQRLHKIIRDRVKRGTVDFFVKAKVNQQRSTSRVNKKILDSYLETVQRLRKQVQDDCPLTPELLLGLPGVIELGEKGEISKAMMSLVEKATLAALDKMCAMRASEGGRLIRGMVKRLGVVERLVKGIERKSRTSCKTRVKKLKARVEEILNGAKLAMNDPSLQREIAMMADRMDISEEIDRLQSHLVAFRRIIDKDGEIGRQLDFLLQEMGREANTIGSKASHAGISQDVVNVKAELEKIREQVQNIE